MPITRSGKLCGAVSNPELLLSTSDNLHGFAPLYQPVNEPRFLEQYRTPKLSMVGSLSGSRQLVSRSAKSARRQKIMEEELAIEMKELEIRKRSLALERSALDQSSDEEEPVVSPWEPKRLPTRQYNEAGGDQHASHCFNSETKNFDPAGIRTRAIGAVANDVVHQPMAAAVELPKIEIDRFDGNPVKFCRFMKLFQMSVAERVLDDTRKLLYLLHYCCGDAKEAIEHCVFLPEHVGYSTAIDILSKQFGRPHDIAESFMSELLNGEPITASDIEALRKLCRQMVSCELALSQMNHSSDLNCSTNIKRIVQRLPRHLQHKWAEAAEDVLRSGSEPAFRHLVLFLERCVSVATNCYGYLANNVRTSRQREQTTFRQPPPGRAHINAVSTGANGSCPECAQSHSISDCRVFSSMSHVKKLERVRDLKLCFNCLQPYHRAFSCRSYIRCNAPNCNQRHHRLLHHVTSPNVSEPTDASVNSLRTSRPSTYLGFVAIRLIGPTGTKVTHAFLDAGSDTTLLSSDVAHELGITGETTQLEVTSINGTSIVKTNEVSFDIQSLEDGSIVNVGRAFTIRALPVRKASIPDEFTLKQWSHLSDVHPNRIPGDSVSILIGINVPEAHWILDQRLGTSKQPYASLTALGWTVFGPASSERAQRISVNCLSTQHNIEDDILKMFASDFNERKDITKHLSVEDEHVLAATKQSVTIIDGHYQVPLPWKIDWKQLPSYRLVVDKRLMYLKRRLAKDPELLDRYPEIFADYERKGYIRKLSSDDSHDLRFVPHHPVFNLQKPGKVRIVFDCAAKFEGRSHNDCLFSEPDLTNDITGVLLRFRLHKIALSADIEKMFLQVCLPPEDRAPFSLLWYTDGNLQQSPDVYQLNVHPFGATSSPFCASFALRQVAADNCEEFDDKAVFAVKNNFYVDDCLVSVDTVSEAIELTDALRRMLRRGGFRLHKWISNCEEVLNSIPISERAPEPVDMMISDSTLQKTLGLYWCIKRDCFRFKLELPTRPATKRGILSCVASLYDPLGFVAPLLLKPKHLIQRLCGKKLGWDEPVDSQTATAWDDWMHDIKVVESLEIPRCITLTGFDVEHTSLHLFSDASEVGYGAVAYARCVSSSGKIWCRFLMGKSRVTPLKYVTIPRLELQAAVLSVRLMVHILQELNLKINETYLWTDSMIVLYYILNKRSRFKTFVANRVSYIHEHTTPPQWMHVPTQHNPADHASRGISCNRRHLLDTWIQGPSFLESPKNLWPKLSIQPSSSDVTGIELKSETTIMAIATSEGAFDHFLRYYSSWMKLKRAVAWMARFKLYLRSKASRERVVNYNCGFLQVGELSEAESTIVRYVQRQSFAEVLRCIERGPSDDYRNVIKASPVRKLFPILREGIICVGGRLSNSGVSSLSMHPVILPSQHPVTQCLIRHYHEVEGHMGTTHLLTKLRERYWIIKGAAAVKKVVNRCISCKVRSAKPGEQIMADLPPCRVEPGYPFAATGIDYFGPFFVLERRVTKKRYGCIFSCLKTRALHIEVAQSLSTDSFLMAFSRFINRRGVPKELYSDQGTNFVGAEKELQHLIKALNYENINNEMLSRQIQWHFNPPYSSHRGGIWERQIRSIRRVLSAVSREQVLTDESLFTFLTEVERILNDRPLVPLYDDPEQMDILTPNHLLLLRHQGDFPTEHANLRDRYTRYWRQGQMLVNAFWRRWTKEYISNLQLRHKWMRVRRDFREGDFVLLTGENVARGKWLKGIVLEVMSGKDGHVREVLLKTTNGVVRRDIRRICLLEGIEDQ